MQPSKEVANLLSAMPAISAWAPRERPAPKTFVQPGRARPAPQAPVMDAAPSLERPNNEPRLSNLNFSAVPRLAAPALRLPPSSTTPVRVIEPSKLPVEPLNAGIGGGAGDAVNLITAGPAILPPNTYVSVPPGVAGAPAESAPAPSTAVAAGKPGTGQGSRAADKAAQARALRQSS